MKKIIKLFISEYKEFFHLRRIIRLAPEASWVFMSQAGVALVSFVAIKLLTNLLGPQEYGRLSIAHTIIVLIVVNFFTPLTQGLIRFWSISKERGILSVFYKVTKSISDFLFWNVLILTLILVFIAKQISSLSGVLLVGLALFTGVMNGIINLKIGVFTAARKREVVALLNIGIVLLRLLIAVPFVVLFAKDTNVALFGYSVASVWVFLITKWFYKRLVIEQTKDQPSLPGSLILIRSLRKEILIYSWPFLAWGMFGWIYSSCDRWALKFSYGNEMVGLFSVISQLAVYPLVFSSAFLTNFLTPIAFQLHADLQDSHSLAAANKILLLMIYTYMACSVLLILIFSMFHNQIVASISNIQFTRFSYLLPSLTIAWALFYLGQILISFGMLIGKPQDYLLPKLVTSVIAALSIFALVPKFGPNGAVLGLLIASAIYAIWCLLIVAKSHKLFPGIKEIKGEDLHAYERNNLLN